MRRALRWELALLGHLVQPRRLRGRGPRPRASLARRCIALLGTLGLAAAAATGCDTSADRCGPGTLLEGDRCVPSEGVDALTCGPGTVRDGDECVLDADTSDGPDASDPSDTAHACVPDCGGRDGLPRRECGDDDCGGSCGDCPGGEECSDLGRCYLPGCVPDCRGEAATGPRACGDDGCGGACGACDDPAAPICTDTGQCVAECVPACLGRACGPDGCGGSCGDCAGGHGCSVHGHCVPDAWQCGDGRYDAGDHCECGCGALDPDCALPGMALVGCGLDELCDDAGACAPRVPAAWTCAPAFYDDGLYCECGCGAPDPDCAEGDLPTLGCAAPLVCGSAGECVACEASCDGRACGGDGCGGTCGSCGDDEVSGAPLVCVAGACVEGCSPTPVLCETNACGDDGCGGSCGACGPDTHCLSGQCVPDPGMSCGGLCGVTAPGGCGCDQGCVERGDCCPDYVSRCTCQPRCDGRVCGDDGCGGTCGACQGELPFCQPDGTCGESCAPLCAGKDCGDDGCGGTCGACDGGAGACNDHQRCVPPGWLCWDHYYGDRAFCDCSCGAPDLDCQTIGQTEGCPLGVACVAETGLCDAAFCAADAQCDKPAWCVGHFPAGAIARKGVCLAPDPAGEPPGAACVSDASCATGLCAAGRCRHHCQQDADCLPGQSCLGVALGDPLIGAPIGVVSVCDGALALGSACASQAACGDATCLALIDPVGHAPLLRCGTPGEGSALGGYCDGATPCAHGLVCADNACGEACPGGQADCPGGTSCAPAALHAGALAAANDDVEVMACTPD